jgi:putative two-component system response regulator
MEEHPLIGWDILGDSKSRLLQVASEIALYHHEKWDGSGYPNGISGDTIPLVGRVVIVSDVFDALTSRRPYKAPWPVEEACAYLRDNSGSHFDPTCVDAFFQSMDEVLDVMRLYGVDDES